MCFNCLIVTHWFHESMKKNRQKPAAAGFNPSLWVGKKLRKTSHSISYEYVTVTNAFAVKFEGLRSSVVSRRLLRFHFQRRSLSCRYKLIQVAQGPLGPPPRFGCSLLLCRSAKRKSGGCRLSNFFVWAKWKNLFLDLPKHSSCAKLQTQRQIHFVTATYSYEVEFDEVFRRCCPKLRIFD